MTVATAVRDLHDEGNSVAEIAFTLGLTTFEVRAVINRHDPPDRGQTFLIPPRKGNGVNLSRRDIPNPWFEKRGTK